MATPQVLTGIDKAQRQFGFHHCDFRLENVMEHTPNPDHHATDAISMAVLGDPTKRYAAFLLQTSSPAMSSTPTLFLPRHPDPFDPVPQSSHLIATLA